MYNFKEILLDSNGRLNKRLCNESKYKIEEKYILNEIFNITSFLDKFNPILRERIYCVLNNINQINKCIICNNKCKFITNSKSKYSNLCESKECYIKYKSNLTSEIMNNRWKNHIKFIKPTITKDERYKKTVATRRKNNKNWFTDEQKLYINKKRIEAVTTDEHKNKMKLIWQDPIKREKQSQTIKKLIKENKFTPPITNTWTHWESIYEYNGVKYKFRSSWEAAFWSVNKHLEFEKLRIQYTYLEKEHTYIVDFIDNQNKIVYEIKPNNKYLIKEKIKEKALIEWCNINNYKYILISNEWFYNNYNKIDFTNNEWLIEKMKQFKNEYQTNK